jgi:hypothetical protein
MLGTDLFQAYDQEQTSNSFGGSENSSVDLTNPANNGTKSKSINLVPPMTEQKGGGVFYDQDALFKEASLQQQIHTLQNQLLRKEADRKSSSAPSTIDLFVSKKKDVVKLLILSLTMLLGLSLHYVASDFIRNYIADNDFTPNQEFMTKIAYPLTVILVIWTLKVYNR